MTPIQRARRAFESAAHVRDVAFRAWHAAFLEGRSVRSLGKRWESAQARVDATYWKLHNLHGWSTPVPGKPRAYRRLAHIHAAAVASSKSIPRRLRPHP